MKTECNCLNGWIENGHICKDLTQNGEPQRHSWGTKKKKKRNSVVKLYEATQMFLMVNYVRQITVKKSCRYGEYRLFQHPLFLLC